MGQADSFGEQKDEPRLFFDQGETKSSQKSLHIEGSDTNSVNYGLPQTT
jgi:hypothetical protein